MGAYKQPSSVRLPAPAPPSQSHHGTTLRLLDPIRPSEGAEGHFPWMRDPLWDRLPRAATRGDQTRLSLRGTLVSCRRSLRVVHLLGVQELYGLSRGQQTGRHSGTYVSPLPYILGKMVYDWVRSVKGKMPGNLDVLFRILANQESGYMMDTFAELFEECGSTTVNLNLLWTDKVRDPSFVCLICDRRVRF